MRLAKLHENISNLERLDAVADFPLKHIMSAPGHHILRDPGAIQSLADYIAASDGKAKFDTPLLLGIFTSSNDADVTLRSIECIDGHHRLLAGLLSDAWMRIGDLPLAQTDTRVNGCPDNSDQPQDRWLPLEIVVRSRIPDTEYSIVQDPRAKGPTASISGRISGRDPVFATDDRGVPFSQLLAHWR